MGGGAGSVDFWATRRTTANGLIALVTRLTGSLLGPSGAAFWDTGTLTRRLYDHTGMRLLSLLELPLVWADTSLLHSGDLNLVGGILSPLSTIAPNPLISRLVTTVQ